MIDLEKADIRAICAVGKNGAIGLSGGLPWGKEKSDLSFFRSQTEGGVVIFGRNTLKENPQLEFLPNRQIFVWHIIQGLERCPGKMLENILEKYEYWPKPPTIWIAGGAQTYRTFAPWIKSLCLTPIDYNGPFDVSFPFDAFFNIQNLQNNYHKRQEQLLDELGIDRK